MPVERLVEPFSALEDPRCAGKVKHRLSDLLVIAVCAVSARAESWDNIARHCQVSVKHSLQAKYSKAQGR